MIQQFLQDASNSISAMGNVAKLGFAAYQGILKRTFVLSVLLALAASLLIIISEKSGFRFFNFLAILAISAVLLVWFVVLLPILGAKELLLSTEWRPVVRLIGMAQTAILTVVVAGVLIMFGLPAGYDGMLWLVAILFTFIGLSVLGFRFSRVFVAKQFLTTSAFIIAGLVVPDSLRFGIADWIQSTAESRGRSLSGQANELSLTLEVLTGSAPDSPLLFDARGRRDLWWCRTDESSRSGYRCYDRSGQDPYTNQQLVPISTVIVETALVNLHSRAQADQAERVALAEVEVRETAERESARNRAEKERRRNEAKARDQAYRESIVLNSNRKLDGALHIRSGNSFDPPIVEELRSLTEFKFGTILRESALSSGAFDRLLRGERSEFEILRLAEKVNLLMLGELEESFVENPAIAGSGELRQELTMVAIEAVTGNVLKRAHFNANAAGQSRSIAEKKLRGVLSTDVRKFIEEVTGLLK